MVGLDAVGSVLHTCAVHEETECKQAEGRSGYHGISVGLDIIELVLKVVITS